MREGGIDEKEIRRILALKNAVYKEEHLDEILQDDGDQFAIDEEMEEIGVEFRKQNRRDMTPEERQKRINALSEVLKGMDKMKEEIANLPEDQLLQPPADFLEKLNRRIQDEQVKATKKEDM